MDIQDFFQACVGKWVSQRTTHHLIEQKNQSDRSDLWVDILDPEHPEVVDLCKLYDLKISQAYGGLNIRWSEVAEAYQSRFKPRNEGATLLVPILDPDFPNRGQILRKLNATTALGTFSLGSDEALTIVLESNDLVTEERMWFASARPSNLRLRSSLIKKNGVLYATTFCSEIRMISQPTPPTDVQSAATQTNS
jgi:CpeS-like protein